MKCLLLNARGRPDGVLRLRFHPEDEANYHIERFLADGGAILIGPPAERILAQVSAVVTQAIKEDWPLPPDGSKP